MNSNVILTDKFRKAAKRLTKKHKSLKSDLKRLFDELQTNPYLGDRLGEQTYKVRIAIKSKGRGKSGGGRVISYVDVAVEDRAEEDEVSVYLLMIYDKSEIENLPAHVVEGLLKEFLSEDD
jgi:mRNA-degrading endonuclease RelE of RelBE toxin-antitoxin system